MPLLTITAVIKRHHVSDKTGMKMEWWWWGRGL